MRYIICSFLIATLHQVSFAQIVNIESQRIQSDTTGWFGNIATSFLFEKNATQVLNISANAHVEFKTSKNLYLFLANYTLLKGSGETLNDNLFYHLRYNHKINSWLRWEVFTQLQQNNVTGIKLRLLAGTGPRFKISGSKNVALYAATASMYEYEKEKTVPTIYHRSLRNSSYFSFNYKLSENAELIGTIFYQPLFSNFSDYRILNEVSIKFKFVKHFSFTASWYYLYDSRPANGIPKLSYSISNGIQYDF
jgi:putative salt-induced outer membrane protein YdiY